MKITLYSENAFAADTQGIEACLSVYLPPKETHEGWEGVLPYGPDSSLPKLKWAEERDKLARQFARLSLKHKCKRANVLKARGIAWQLKRLDRAAQRLSSIREPSVVIERSPLGPESGPLLLDQEHVDALRAALDSLALRAPAEEPEPVIIRDGGRGTLTLQTHRRKQTVSWWGYSAPAELQPLIGAMLVVWNTYHRNRRDV